MDFLFCNLYQRNEKYLKGLCLPILFQTAYPWQLNWLIITGGGESDVHCFGAEAEGM